MEDASLISPEQATEARPRIRPKGRRRADLAFPEYIKKKLDYIDRLNEMEERRRIETYVTLTRRYRGDLFSFFAADRSGRWIECDNLSLKRVNIVAPIVRANNKNWMEARVRLQVAPTNSHDPDLAGAADIAQAIIDLLCERDWDDWFEETISELAQLSSAYFIYSRFNKNKGPKLRVPQMARKSVDIQGKFYCPTCDVSGPSDQAEMTGGCPQCGGAVTLSDPAQVPDLDMAEGYEEMPGGDNETCIYTSYEMKVDERNAKGGDLSKCRWVRNNYLVYRNELEEMRPWAKLDGKSEWTPGLQYQRQLETSSHAEGLGELESNNESDEDLLDFRRYWLDKKSLMGYVAPADYSHGDSELGYLFEIKEGQTIEEAFDDEFEGLYVERHGDEVLIYDNESHRKRWTVGHFQMDATSFWGKAQEDLLDLQEMIIEIVNIFFQAGMTMSLPPLIIDGKLLSAQNFTNDPGSIVYTSNHDRNGRPISDYIHQLFPQGPDNSMFGFLQALMQTTEETGGVSKASVGQGDPANKTARGQELLTQRSVGLMVPSQKSKARAKREWAYQQLELAKEYWTSGRYIPIQGKYGEEWKEADVEGFRNADIRRDFVIRIVEGSDTPQSLEEREMKLVGLLTSGVLENPTIPVQLKQLLVRYAGVDYDIENFEAEIRLATARLRKVDERIPQIEEAGMAWLMDEMGPVLDPYGNPMVNPEGVNLIVNALGIQPIPEADNHPVHAEFWVDQIKAEAAAAMPDPLKLAVYRQMVQLHAMSAAGMQAVSNQLSVQAETPLVEKQQEMEDASNEKQMARDEQTKDNDAARQMAMDEAMGPKGPPTVSAPSLS